MEGSYDQALGGAYFGLRLGNFCWCVFFLKVRACKSSPCKRVLSNPTRLAPKRGAQFSQEDVLAEISKLTQKI
jgi:hypothetical protein